MDRNAQRRAVENYRSRMARRGVVRFEVAARRSDRELVRAVAQKLAEGGEGAERLRAAVSQSLSAVPGERGGILRALLASPLAGSELKLVRVREAARKVEL